MKETIKNLYNIDSKAFVKYTNKVYKIKANDDCEYCLKYLNIPCNNSLIEKINTLNLNDSFVMPLKTCIRTSYVQKDNKVFLISPWIENDYVESKELKIKYYLEKIGSMHNKTLYSLNVTKSYFHEITLRIEEQIEECFQKYEQLIRIIEKKEYKSPFEWYFTNNFKEIINSLDKSRSYLNKFKEIVKDKSMIRQVIIHQNFSYDHIFITKNKIIGNDKMKLASPIFDLKALFDVIDFGSIDVSGMLSEYFKYFSLEDYEKKWLLSLLFIVNDLKITNNDFLNLRNLMQILFKYKSINELENKLEAKNN